MDHRLGMITKSSCSPTVAVAVIIIMLSLMLLAKLLWLWHSSNSNCQIPSFTFRSSSSGSNCNKKKKEEGEEDMMMSRPFCVVCLHEAMDGERLRKLPKCNHCFHVGCIDAWFQVRHTCPLCRNPVLQIKRRRRNNDEQRRQGGLLFYFLSLGLFLLRRLGESLDFEVTISLGDQNSSTYVFYR